MIAKLIDDVRRTGGHLALLVTTLAAASLGIFALSLLAVSRRDAEMARRAEKAMQQELRAARSAILEEQRLAVVAQSAIETGRGEHEDLVRQKKLLDDKVASLEALLRMSRPDTHTSYVDADIRIETVEAEIAETGVVEWSNGSSGTASTLVLTLRVSNARDLLLAMRIDHSDSYLVDQRKVQLPITAAQPRSTSIPPNGIAIVKLEARWPIDTVELPLILFLQAKIQNELRFIRVDGLKPVKQQPHE